MESLRLRKRFRFLLDRMLPVEKIVPPPTPVERRYVPNLDDVQVANIEVYLQTWAEVLKSDAGEALLAFLRRRLWLLTMECPPAHLVTIEARALWREHHDGQVMVLAELVQDAQMSVQTGPDNEESPLGALVQERYKQ